MKKRLADERRSREHDAATWVSYDYAVLRVVPHVYVGAFAPIGVMVHARTAEYLAIRTLDDSVLLRTRAAGVDPELLTRYLRVYRAVCEGDASAGPVALAPTSERFHWLTAPSSTIVQASPVHTGLTADPAAELEHLFATLVQR